MLHKKIKKFVKKAIPKEIAPFVPAVAGMFLGPAASGILGKFGAGLAAKGGILGGIGGLLSKPMVAGALGRGLVDVGTQALTSDRIDPLSAAISGGLGAFSQYQPNVVGDAGPLQLSGLQKAGLQLKKLGQVGQQGDLLKMGKLLNVQGTTKAASDELDAEEKRMAIARAKNEALKETDDASRRQAIIESMIEAGFTEVDGEQVATQEGYAFGGRVGLEMGGMPERGGGANEEAMAEMMMKLESGEFYIDEEGNLRRIPRRRPRMNTRPGMNEDAIADQMFMMQMNERMGRKDGGKVPGLPAGRQVDAREGMFIPMGGAKRADDVPAMLSVNEFVLNDDAVAGLGKLMTGSPDPRAGARALYKIQDQLEAMV